jgi:hypothetical protein
MQIHGFVADGRSTERAQMQENGNPKVTLVNTSRNKNCDQNGDSSIQVNLPSDSLLMASE